LPAGAKVESCDNTARFVLLPQAMRHTYDFRALSERREAYQTPAETAVLAADPSGAHIYLGVIVSDVRSLIFAMVA